MKKILKIALLLIGIIPFAVINAEESEVKYKWYKEVEEDVTYQTNVENVCEYFDKENFIYTNYSYSESMPEKIDGREIINEIVEFDINRYYFNKLKITRFGWLSNSESLYIREIEVYDNGKPLDFDIVANGNIKTNLEYLNDKNYDTGYGVIIYDNMFLNFNEFVDTRNVNIRIYYDYNPKMSDIYAISYNDDIFTNAYDNADLFINTNCDENNICMFDATVDERYIGHTPIKISSIGYHYRDKLYKCYSKNKLYIPGYHKDLSEYGFIKDDTDYIIEEIEEPKICPIIMTENKEDFIPITKIKPIESVSNKCNENIVSDINDIDEDKEEVSILEPEEQHKIDKTSPIAMVTKVEAKESIPTYLIFITIFLILSILLTITLIARKVKKCRTK